ncbi:hypothetical protein [Priestia koreensis]|uniref:hypothetical protein n=1 Tax=Priestia koreensis TaxID=284581 RepID=UPI001F5A6AF8|nr:hypothetical protein [Priestia koreensis]UNL83554.1 hypothetical protein IE339_15455 [Priestia koreensis]
MSNADQPKKVSLQELMKQKLADKQQTKNAGQGHKMAAKSAQPLQSQQTKKRNNQRKRTGV